MPRVPDKPTRDMGPEMTELLRPLQHPQPHSKPMSAVEWSDLLVDEKEKLTEARATIKRLRGALEYMSERAVKAVWSTPEMRGATITEAVRRADAALAATPASEPEEHQCGGPKEACGKPGCLECGTPAKPTPCPDCERMNQEGNELAFQVTCPGRLIGPDEWCGKCRDCLHDKLVSLAPVLEAVRAHCRFHRGEGEAMKRHRTYCAICEEARAVGPVDAPEGGEHECAD